MALDKMEAVLSPDESDINYGALNMIYRCCTAGNT